MKNKGFFFLIATTLLLSSCSLLLKQAYDEKKNRLDLLPQEASKLYCGVKESYIEMIGPDKKNQDRFLEFIKKSNMKWTTAEKFVLWSLLHFNLRPDKVSPLSQVQLFGINGRRINYLAYSGDQVPLIHALNDLLIRTKSKNDITKLGIFIEKNAKFPQLVDQELEEFFESNKDAIWTQSELRETLFKDNQILKAGESLPSFKNSLLGVPAPKSAGSYIAKDLTDYKSFCNFEPEDYKKNPSKTIQLPNEIPSPLIIGLKEGNEIYLASIEQYLSGNDIKKNSTPYLKMKQTPLKSLSPFCLIALNEDKLLLLASKVREAKQLLLPYEKSLPVEIKGKNDIPTFLNKTRKIKLYHPTRMIFEASSERLAQGQDGELEKLLKEDIPVYQAPLLGELDALLISENFSFSGFIRDKRYPTRVSCDSQEKKL